MSTCRALLDATHFINLLPPTAVWSFTMTDATGEKEAAALTIVVSSEAETREIAYALMLGRPVWAGFGIEEYEEGHLTISIQQDPVEKEFDDDEYAPLSLVPEAATKTDEGITVADLYWSPVEATTSGRGLYLAADGAQILYIGQAANIRKRVVTHTSNPWFRWFARENGRTIKWYWTATELSSMDALEKALIKSERPLLNQNYKERT